MNLSSVTGTIDLRFNIHLGISQIMLQSARDVALLDEDAYPQMIRMSATEKCPEWLSSKGYYFFESTKTNQGTAKYLSGSMPGLLGMG